MLEPQPDPHPAPAVDPASRAVAPADGAHPSPGVPVMDPWASADLGRVRAVIDALPEAVFVTESDGELRLTNPAADRLFAGQPVHSRDDLLNRFEEVAPAGPTRPISDRLEDGQDPVTVRPRAQPNRWFTLRSVALDPAIVSTAASAGGSSVAGEPCPATAARPDTAASAGTPAIPASGQSSASDPLPAARAATPVDRATDPAAAHDAAAATADGRTVFVLRDVTDTRELRPVREAFLAILSHELRTPITTIYAGSSVLARPGALSPPASRTLASDISAEAARLYDLVEDLLVLARLERRVLDPLDEPVLLQRAVDATIRTVADRFGKGLVERSGKRDLPPAHGDATYVEQACRNLVMASIRYADDDPDGRLAIETSVDPDAGECRVAVLDRGPGLSRSELDRAFELPDEGATGRLAAAGVGPFVCRHLIEAMGGRVWATNRPDGGLELGFALRIDERA